MKRLLFLLFALSFYVFADSEYFEIKDVEVKQESKNSLVAKEEALRKAARLAFKEIIESEAKPLSVESVSDHKIQDCVYDYSIEQEKFSESFYIGRISYRFSKHRVASLLKSFGLDADFGKNENEKFVRLAIHPKAFLYCANELKKLKVVVERFSNERVVFRIDKELIGDFRKLGVKYARAI
jgi:hypothetical protein